MRRVIVSEFVTLDGVMEDPGGAEGFKHGGWSFKFPSPEALKFKLDEVLAADALLLGRRTYEGFAAAWPGRTDDVGFADQMNRMAKHVVSTTLREPRWNNTTVLRDDVPSRVSALTRQPGKDILVAGSAQLVRTLLHHDLVDEYRLLVSPIVLGAGRRLFGDGVDTTVLRLKHSQMFSSGVILLVYAPARR
jgi:dihydrofolate reductase